MAEPAGAGAFAVPLRPGGSAHRGVEFLGVRLGYRTEFVVGILESLVHDGIDSDPEILIDGAAMSRMSCS